MRIGDCSPSTRHTDWRARDRSQVDKNGAIEGNTGQCRVKCAGRKSFPLSSPLVGEDIDEGFTNTSTKYEYVNAGQLGQFKANEADIRLEAFDIVDCRFQIEIFDGSD